ncbi:MAG: BlaI/MecI/CopY family transcriptional regulator [Bacteroidales bacterium]|jgi:predicted transcriptional regulator|nr:BlaI/MecI/CopY family transcriptional regulator [Bacteroidales bacterium]
MKDLTKAEEQIMHILWNIEKGFVNDIMENLPEPKPAYNTVSTIVRILEKKGFVDHNAYGKTHEYYPLVSKDKYTKSFMKGFVENYFSNSYQNMVSFFSKNENLSTKEIEDIIKILQEQVDSKKK